MAVCREISSRFVDRPAERRASERGAQVAYHVELFRTGGVLYLVDRIVDIFQVPIVDNRHQNSQPIQLAGTLKGAIGPLPVGDLLAVLSLQAYVAYGAI